VTILQATGHPGSATCGWLRREPTLDEILAEPIVKAVMAADGLTAADFSAALNMAITGHGRRYPAAG
jgi:hypothetical protein